MIRMKLRGIRGKVVKCMGVFNLIVVALMGLELPAIGEDLSQNKVQSNQGQPPIHKDSQNFPFPQVQPVNLGESKVILKGGKLSVSLRKAALRDVLETIAQHGGPEVTFIGEVGGTNLTESFTSLPLEDGLIRLLGSRNYALVYSGTSPVHRVSQVIVLPVHENLLEGSVGQNMDREGGKVAGKVGKGDLLSLILSGPSTKKKKNAVDMERIVRTLQAAVAAVKEREGIEDQDSQRAEPPEHTTNLPQIFLHQPERGKNNTMPGQLQKLLEQVER